ncbi:MAG: SPOR domain-containing protein [Chlorobi bacterium]|nr:SPOR domain-containing protein [Chlorobiota bacterium]
MMESLVETIQLLARDYAIPSLKEEHFTLNQHNRYPGNLPFPVAEHPVNNTSVDEPLQLSPALLHAIQEELERHTPSPERVDDPLERLAAQLQEVSIPNDIEDASDSPSSTDEAHPVTSDIPTAEEQPSPSLSEAATRPHISRRIVILSAVGLFGLLMLLGLYFALRHNVQDYASTRSYSTDTNVSIPQQHDHPLPDRDRSVPHNNLPDVPPLPSRVERDTSPRKASPSPAIRLPRPNKLIASSAISKKASVAKSGSPSLNRSRASSEPIIAVVTPPRMEQPTGAAIFTIQVCSTPSYAEALRWKEYIQQRSTFPISIVQHRIRSELYYRVRVGNFLSLVEAQRATTSLGLNPAVVWIVQIK